MKVVKEKKNQEVEIVFILDRSGSMGGLENDTIGGYNSFIKSKKDFNAKCIKTRYGIVGKQAKVKIDLDPYKVIGKE